MNELNINVDIKEFVIIDNNKEFKFYAPKLKVSQQIAIIIKIINLVANGSITNKLEVAQILHNMFQTGVKVEGANDNNKIPAMTMLFEAIKGTLANLDEQSFNDLFYNKLIIGLTIDDGTGKAIKVTKEELDNKFTDWKSVGLIFIELVRYNLGFF